MNITDVFCQYISDHILPQWLPFQLSAPLLHITLVLLKKVFNNVLSSGCDWLTGVDGASVHAVAVL